MAETASKATPSTADPPSSATESGFEFLDHTADVQLHAWGPDLRVAIEQLVAAFYAYQIEDTSFIADDYSMDISASGHDVESMIYNLLVECLFVFETEPFFIGKSVQVVDFDPIAHKISIRARGESFDRSRHPPGTAIKAITFASMQIHENIDDKAHVYVIVDI